MLTPSPTVAHPGDPKRGLDKQLKDAYTRHAIADINNDALSKCNDLAKTQTRREIAMKRRWATFQRLRAERDITDEPYVHRRDNAAFAKWGKTSHDKTSQLKFTPDTPHLDIFGANSTCIMTPDSIIGPYFVLDEQIRSNVIEGKKGVPLHLEVQFVDVNTCKPSPGFLIDIWHCDASGVYSGVSAAGQAGLKSTFLSGAQETNKDGVVEFETIFPGHYQGQASHQHLSAHTGWPEDFRDRRIAKELLSLFCKDVSYPPSHLDFHHYKIQLLTHNSYAPFDNVCHVMLIGNSWFDTEMVSSAEGTCLPYLKLSVNPISKNLDVVCVFDLFMHSLEDFMSISLLLIPFTPRESFRIVSHEEVVAIAIIPWDSIWPPLINMDKFAKLSGPSAGRVSRVVTLALVMAHI